VKFKTDENLPVEVASLLRESGHDALTVIDQQMAGHPDGDLAAVCRAEQRALVTLDLDFADSRAYPPDQYCGLIVLRPRVQTISMLQHLTKQMVQLLDTQPLVGYLWIVEEQRVRIRSGIT
jgi:predicted nuclease of predicted toxin-antitoxin system